MKKIRKTAFKIKQNDDDDGDDVDDVDEKKKVESRNINITSFKNAHSYTKIYLPNQEQNRTHHIE